MNIWIYLSKVNWVQQCFPWWRSRRGSGCQWWIPGWVPWVPRGTWTRSTKRHTCALNQKSTSTSSTTWGFASTWRSTTSSQRSIPLPGGPLDAPPNSLIDSNASCKTNTSEEGIGVCSFVHSTSGVEGHVGAPRWGLGRMVSESIIHINLHKPNNKLVSVYLKHFWYTDEPRAYIDEQDLTQLGLGGNHHLPPYSISMIGHKGCTQMSFFLGLSSRESRNSWNCNSHHFGHRKLLV